MPQHYLTKADKRNKIVTKENRLYIWNYLKTHPCVDCGETDPVVLEFDHIHGKKKYLISKMSSFPLKLIKTEIKKCDVRCANCHRRRTAKQLGWYKYLVE